MNIPEPLRRTVHFSCYGNQRGVVIVLFALLLPVLIGIAALAVDIGYAAITRNQLQNASDAAALAGAGKLGSIYLAQTPPLSLSSSEEANIATVAITVGLQNEAAGKPPNIGTSDIVIGYWDSSVNTFSNTPPTGRIPNAVRVTARPSGGGTIPLGAITTFFANIFGISNVAVLASATASLTSPCSVEPGGLSPFVVSADHPYCSDPTVPRDIVFTANDPLVPPCAGWQTLDAIANTSNMRDFLNTLLQDHEPTACPATCAHGSANFDIVGKEVGETTHVINGLTTTQWECLQNLYLCYRNEFLEWIVTTPVVQRPCGQINQVPVIETFATVSIKGVTRGEGSNVVVEGVACGPSPCIKAEVVCDYVIPEKGGGCSFRGTYGSIPGIVDKTLAP